MMEAAISAGKKPDEYTCDFQKKIVKEASEFADVKIRPFASEFDENFNLPKELIDDMAERGYLGANLPKEYGGLGLDEVHYGLFTEEIGKACPSTRSLITVHTSLVSSSILRWGTKEQKEYWLPKLAKGERIAAFALSEPNAGSDAAGVETRYEKNDDHFVLNGVKKWITCADIADVFLVIASDGARVTAFLVERSFDGVETSRIKDLLAGRASHMAEITLKDVKVPVENVLGIEGGGFAYVVNTALDHGRYSIAWAGVAIAQEALDAMVNYTRRRKQFDQKIYKFQLIQGMIADATTKIHAARALCLKAGEMRKSGDEDAVMETNMAKYFSSKIAMEVATDAVQIHGAIGFTREFPVERLFREAKVLEIIEGTSQLQQGMIAQFALKRFYKKDKS